MGQRIGTYIHKLRQQNRASIREVSDQVGLSPSHLSLIERGQREVSINTLYPIMQALRGDFNCALRLLVLDAGIPEEILSQGVLPWQKQHPECDDFATGAIDIGEA